MIFRSPYPDVEIPSLPLTPFVFQGVESRAQKPALIDGTTGRTLTYGDLFRLIRRAAAGLAARGFEKGDVFAIAIPNVPEYAVIFHAVSLLGGVSTTVNPLVTVEEMAHQLKDSGAKYLLTIPQLAEKGLEAARKTGVREVFLLGEGEGTTRFASLLEIDGEPPAVGIDPREDVVVMPYSSGTTGLPKGVMLTHFNLVANTLQVTRSFDAVTEDDTLMGVLPFFHIYGLVVILTVALYHKATVVTLPRFDLPQFLETLQKYRVSFAHVVPPIVLALGKHPLVDQYDLSHLKIVFSGAAPLSENVADACARRVGCAVVQGYGMTEASPATHTSPGDLAKCKPGSVGPTVPNTECKIVDVETGAALGPGKNGELWVRGPQVMKGYLNNPDATAQTVDTEGWLHTGDVGYADEDGHFFIVDRLKELIKYKGLQVAPAELEAVLLAHPQIADAAVVPLKDEEAGEVPVAFVVLRGDVSAAEIQAFVAERVAPYKKIRRVEFIDQIPKSPSGKILRRLLVGRVRQA